MIFGGVLRLPSTPCSINVEVQVGILSLNMDVGTIWFSWGNWNPSMLVDPPWILVYMEPDQMSWCMAKCISMESDQEVVPQEVKKFKKHHVFLFFDMDMEKYMFFLQDVNWKGSIPTGWNLFHEHLRKATKRSICPGRTWSINRTCSAASLSKCRSRGLVGDGAGDETRRNSQILFSRKQITSNLNWS